MLKKLKFSIVLLTMCKLQNILVDGQHYEVTLDTQECRLTPVLQFIQYPGCIEESIRSYACIGKCTSYVQVSGVKVWQMERSCNCCQESVETETSVTLECPQAPLGESKYRTVTAKSPLECMCRPCSTFDESEVVPQEIAGYAEESLNNFYRKSFD